MSASLLTPPVRPEFERSLEPLGGIAPVLPLPLAARIWQQAFVRKLVILAVLAVLWEVVARWQDNDLLLPTFLQTAKALVEGLASGELIAKTAISLSVLLKGYLAGILGAFVLIHSVLWPLALNTYAGFQSVPETLRMAGRNYGLTGIRYVLQILVPAALPSILSGLKIGWAFAWRTLIAAELVFGASAGKGGLGWYIFQNRNELYTDKVFGGLVLVILIGLAVESLGFHTLERLTVRRWGVQR